MEKQTATTAEVERNVQQAARGSQEINQNITGVAQSQQATQELTRLAIGLQEIVGQL